MRTTTYVVFNFNRMRLLKTIHDRKWQSWYLDQVCFISEPAFLITNLKVIRYNSRLMFGFCFTTCHQISQTRSEPSQKKPTNPLNHQSFVIFSIDRIERELNLSSNLVE